MKQITQYFLEGESLTLRSLCVTICLVTQGRMGHIEKVTNSDIKGRGV